MLDLCEDDDVIIRKQAVKALPNICRDAPENVFKIADVLAQLSQTEDTTELGVVFNSLVSIFSIDPTETFRGIFGQVHCSSGFAPSFSIKEKLWIRTYSGGFNVLGATKRAGYHSRAMPQVRDGENAGLARGWASYERGRRRCFRGSEKVLSGLERKRISAPHVNR